VERDREEEGDSVPITLLTANVVGTKLEEGDGRDEVDVEMEVLEVVIDVLEVEIEGGSEELCGVASFESTMNACLPSSSSKDITTKTPSAVAHKTRN